MAAKAEEFGLHTSNVQRDYVYGWLIYGLFAESRLGEVLALKGGNALRKGYFPTTRFSDDLDFTTQVGLDADLLIEAFNEICRFAEARSGVQFDIDRNQIADEHFIDRMRKVYKLRLYFRDFFGNESQIVLKVRVDVTEYDRIYLPLQRRLLIHPYSDASDCLTEIRAIKLEEALADKLKCLLQRAHSHDLFDLVHATLLRHELDIDRLELVSTFLRKTIFEPSPGTARSLLLNAPFELMRDFWDRIVCPRVTRVPFEQAIDGFRDAIRDLFAPFGPGDQYAAHYFPAELRTPIVRAGAERKLLLLRYHGITRFVEPYSLTFKRRNDGVAQEYFYGWDRTGGRSGRAGIKAFLRGDIQGLVVTDEEFQPRFEIELSKAGDRPSSGQLAERFPSGAKGPRARRARVRARARYRLRCTYCGKTFARSSPTTSLNSHKDGYGNRCLGRIGVRVF